MYLSSSKIEPELLSDPVSVIYLARLSFLRFDIIHMLPVPSPAAYVLFPLQQLVVLFFFYQLI